MKPAVGYLRRSTDRQEQSLADQEAVIRRYAADHGFEILRLYMDDAASGTSADNRPDFQRMIADADHRECDFRFVLCYDVKRFSRGDNDEAGYYRHILKKRGIEVVYTSEGFRGDDTDDLVRPVKQFLARQESKDLSKVTLRGQLSRLHSGSYLGGVPPYGFDYLYSDSRRNPIHVVRFNENGEKLLFDPRTGEIDRVVTQGERLSSSKQDRLQLVPSALERVAIIRRIFDEYIAGNGYRSIATRFNSEGVPSPRSRQWDPRFDGRWGLSTVRNIVVNPVYVGDTVWNRFTEAKFHRASARGVVERRPPGQRVREPNPREDWVVTSNTHEGLVSRAVFNEAQALRLKRHAEGHHTTRPQGRGYYSNYLLTSLIRCADCDHNFIGHAHKSRACYKDHRLPRPRYYVCGGYVRKGNRVCRRRAYPVEPFEMFILDRLQERFLAFIRNGGEAVMRRCVREILADAGPTPEKAIAEVKAEIARLRKDVDRLLLNLSPTNREFVDEKLAEIRQRLRHLDAKQDELQARAYEEVVVDSALAQLRRFRRVLAHGSVVEQKELLRGFIDTIVLTPSSGVGVITWLNLPGS